MQVRLFMSQKLLPIGEPPIRGYQHHANPLSVIASEDLDYLPWLYSNYIQLYYDPTSITGLNFYFNGFVPNFFTVSNPLLDIQIIKKETLHINNINIVSFILNLLDNGKYFETSINEYYISNRTAYLKRNFDHEMLVYGYDLNKKCFYTLGYDKSGLYSTTEVSFDTFEKAYSSTSAHPYSQMIRVYEKKYFKGEKVKYNFDIKLVLILLEDYLSSNNTSERLRMIAPPLVNCKFGIDACRTLISFLDNISQDHSMYDIRPFHILFEHKKCMLNRIAYMQENNYIKNPGNILGRYKNIEATSLELRNMLLKWSLTKKDKIIDNMKETLSNMINEEHAILSELMRNISHC